MKVKKGKSDKKEKVMMDFPWFNYCVCGPFPLISSGGVKYKIEIKRQRGSKSGSHIGQTERGEKQDRSQGEREHREKWRRNVRFRVMCLVVLFSPSCMLSKKNVHKMPHISSTFVPHEQVTAPTGSQDFYSLKIVLKVMTVKIACNRPLVGWTRWFNAGRHNHVPAMDSIYQDNGPDPTCSLAARRYSSRAKSLLLELASRRRWS